MRAARWKRDDHRRPTTTTTMALALDVRKSLNGFGYVNGFRITFGRRPVYARLRYVRLAVQQSSTVTSAAAPRTAPLF